MTCFASMKKSEKPAEEPTIKHAPSAAATVESTHTPAEGTNGQEQVVPPVQPNSSNASTQAAAPSTQEAPQSESSPAEDWQSQLAAAKKDSAEHYEQMLRAKAELENFKKRILREQQEVVRYANSSLLRDCLSALDNLERALQATEQTKGNSSETQALSQGVSMVARQMQEIFSRHGLHPIKAEPQQPFNPDRHEALSTVENPQIPEGQIVEVLQAGWMLHQRILRPAGVSVAKASTIASDIPSAGTQTDTQTEIGTDHTPSAAASVDTSTTKSADDVADKSADDVADKTQQSS